MNFLGIGGILKAGAKLADEFITTDEEREQARIEMRKLDIEEARLADAGSARQVAVNLEEAKHKSVFVAGWRPFIGWVCGVSLAWHFCVADIAAWVVAVSGSDIVLPVLLGTEELITITLGLLGLGGLRTFEKMKGVARSSLADNK